MRNYKCLSEQIFKYQNFHLEPIRDSDKNQILKIRNEQMYHLRQSEILTTEAQEKYFSTVIANLFEQERPTQVLFSFFENNNFIGYGGLVHINWINKNAEISFVMKTELEIVHFKKYWTNYLILIELVAFKQLKFHKIYTYAYDIRPHLFEVLIDQSFCEEARLKEHCYYKDRYIDVVFHCKFNRNIFYRKANELDKSIYFEWANDLIVRENSYNSKPISLEDHENWFLSKIKNTNCQMLIFYNHLNQAIGQVRIQKDVANTALIGVSTDFSFRGKGYATVMINIATELFLENNPQSRISAYIKVENKTSIRAFEKAGFNLDNLVEYCGIPSFHYKKQK